MTGLSTMKPIHLYDGEWMAAASGRVQIIHRPWGHGAVGLPLRTQL
jgi:hypothetical protein